MFLLFLNYVIIFLVSLIGICVHEKIAAIGARRWRALGLRRIVFRAPIVAELVSSDQFGLALQQTTLQFGRTVIRAEARVDAHAKRFARTNAARSARNRRTNVGETENAALKSLICE